MTSAATFDLGETDRLLTTTRAVRKRLDLARPVPRDVVLECLRIAIQAPSGSNSQPWRWLVVDEPAKRAAVAEYYRKSHDPYLAAGREAMGDAITAPQERVLDSSQYLSDHLHEVPVLVIPCLLQPLPAQPTTADAAGLFGSILPGAWSFMLALRSRGLGSVITTLHLHYEREVGELLGIPGTVTQAALIPVAYYTGDDFQPAPRRPIESVTYWNNWGNKS